MNENKGQFKIGNNAASKTWEDVEQLQQDINSYFELCNETIVHYDSNGKPITEPYTIEGLALTLGVTRQTLLNYEKLQGYEPFFDTIKNAKEKISKQKLINGLVGKSNATITIFDLKNNHGYKDKHEVETKDTTIRVKDVN